MSAPNPAWTAIAWLPCSPILVPAIGTGESAELGDLRAAAADAIAVVIETAPDAIVVLAPAMVPDGWEPAGRLRPSFHGFGVGEPPSGPALPWQFGLAAWLLTEAGWTGRCGYLGVAESGGADTHPTSGVRDSRRLGLVVLADGARHGDLLPGVDGDIPDAWDQQLLDIANSADPRSLADLDDVVGRLVLSTASQVWPVAARILATSPRSWIATVTYASAPWDVGYLVASWG